MYSLGPCGISAVMETRSSKKSDSSGSSNNDDVNENWSCKINDVNVEFSENVMSRQTVMLQEFSWARKQLKVLKRRMLTLINCSKISEEEIRSVFDECDLVLDDGEFAYEAIMNEDCFPEAVKVQAKSHLEVLNAEVQRIKSMYETVNAQPVSLVKKTSSDESISVLPESNAPISAALPAAECNAPGLTSLSSPMSTTALPRARIYQGNAGLPHVYTSALSAGPVTPVIVERYSGDPLRYF